MGLSGWNATIRQGRSVLLKYRLSDIKSWEVFSFIRKVFIYHFGGGSNRQKSHQRGSWVQTSPAKKPTGFNSGGTNEGLLLKPTAFHCHGEPTWRWTCSDSRRESSYSLGSSPIRYCNKLLKTSENESMAACGWNPQSHTLTLKAQLSKKCQF